MFEEFSKLWQQNDDEIKKFIGKYNKHGTLGIHQFKFRGPVVTPSNEFFYIERDNLTLHPIQEIEPIKSETFEDIRLESHKMYLLISLNQALKEKNAPKVKEILNNFIKIWYIPLWDKPNGNQFDDWSLLNMVVPMALENIFSDLLTRIEVKVKLERTNPELSDDGKRLYLKNQFGNLWFEPICPLAKIWFELIKEISIKGHTVGLCHFCGEPFTSQHPDAKTCCPEHREAQRQRNDRRKKGASDKRGRRPGTKNKPKESEN